MTAEVHHVPVHIRDHFSEDTFFKSACKDFERLEDFLFNDNGFTKSSLTADRVSVPVRRVSISTNDGTTKGEARKVSIATQTMKEEMKNCNDDTIKVPIGNQSKNRYTSIERKESITKVPINLRATEYSETVSNNQTMKEYMKNCNDDAIKVPIGTQFKKREESIERKESVTKVPINLRATKDSESVSKNQTMKGEINNSKDDTIKVPIGNQSKNRYTSIERKESVTKVPMNLRATKDCEDVSNKQTVKGEMNNSVDDTIRVPIGTQFKKREESRERKESIIKVPINLRETKDSESASNKQTMKEDMINSNDDTMKVPIGTQAKNMYSTIERKESIRKVPINLRSSKNVENDNEIKKEEVVYSRDFSNEAVRKVPIITQTIDKGYDSITDDFTNKAANRKLSQESTIKVPISLSSEKKLSNITEIKAAKEDTTSNKLPIIDGLGTERNSLEKLLILPRTRMMMSNMKTQFKDMNLFQTEDPQVIRMVDKKDKLEISLDTADYRPDELRVSVADAQITIKGKHEERDGDDDVVLRRQFVRRYSVPRRIGADQVTCNLSSDGVLVVTAIKGVDKVVDVKINQS